MMIISIIAYVFTAIACVLVPQFAPVEWQTLTLLTSIVFLSFQIWHTNQLYVLVRKQTFTSTENLTAANAIINHCIGFGFATFILGCITPVLFVLTGTVIVLGLCNLWLYKSLSNLHPPQLGKAFPV